VVEQWNGSTVEYRNDELNIIAYGTSARPVINNRLQQERISTAGQSPDFPAAWLPSILSTLMNAI
jgi:hypothetical protein